MADVKVPGGTVHTRDTAHVCATPLPRKFDVGDVFECGECGARHKLKDAQQYEGGPYWDRIKR